MHIRDVAKQYQCWLDRDTPEGRAEAMATALRVLNLAGKPDSAQLERDAWAVVDGPVIQIWDVRTERSRSNLRAGWTEVPGKPR